MCYFVVEEYARASDLLARVVDAGSGNVGLSYTLALALIKQGKSDEANRRIAQMIERGGNSPQLHIVLGQAYYEQGDTAKALEEYEGRYRAAADLSYVIRREGDHLIGERQGLPPVTLAQEAGDVFFVAGQPRDRKIFRRDADNRIIDFVDRREGEDLVFIRGK